MPSDIARGLLRWCACAVAMVLVAGTVPAEAKPRVFSETWESYTNGVLPYDGWKLDKGSLGYISDEGRGGGKCYFIRANGQSRLCHKVNLSACKDIVLQGWLYDSGGVEMNRCILGLVDEPETSGGRYPLIRMGMGDSGKRKTYKIMYFDHLQSEAGIVVDTKLPCEKGWHFMRLEIMHDRTVNYRVWNAARTIEKKGNFGWVFDKAKFNHVVVGSGSVTPGVVGWDDIQVGSLEQIAVPERVPESTAQPVETK